MKIKIINECSEKAKQFYKKEIGFNPLQKRYIFLPNSPELSKKQQRIALITSIAVGIITLGLLHLYLYLEKNNHVSNDKFKKIHTSNGNERIVKDVKYWKQYPPEVGNAWWKAKDFSYEKPELDTNALNGVSSTQKDAVEKHCFKMMRDSMSVLDYSIVDAVNECIRQNQFNDLLDVVDKFSSRMLDLYEAYTAIIYGEDDSVILPLEVGTIKGSGYTHEEILSLRLSCQWYKQNVDLFEEELAQISVSEKDAALVTEFIANNKYRWKDALFEEMNNQLEQDYSDFKDDIIKTCESFLKRLNENKKHLDTIKGFDKKTLWLRNLSQKDKEDIKGHLANIDTPENPAQSVVDKRRKIWTKESPEQDGLCWVKKPDQKIRTYDKDGNLKEETKETWVKVPKEIEWEKKKWSNSPNLRSIRQV